MKLHRAPTLNGFQDFVTHLFQNATPGGRHSPSAQRSWLESSGWFWAILLVVTLWKSLAGMKLGLIFDECYYWEWSLHPQSCYFDHPPLTAWLIASAHRVFGHGILAVRFWAIVSGILLALGGRLLATDMFGTNAGNRAGIFLLLAPIFAGNALLMTPDSFLMPAWAFAVFFAWKGYKAGSSPGWWVASGAAAGIGLLDKYTMILFYGGLAFLWLFTPGRRGPLFRGITMAAVVSFLFFLPVLRWNQTHDWSSFEHQIHHGFRNEHESLINFENLANYAAFLIILVSPLLGLFCFRSAITRLEDERFRFLALFYWTVVLFFGFSAAKAHVEANWPMVAFVTGLILVAGDWESYGRAWRASALTLLLVADFGALIGVTALALPKDSPLAIRNLTLNTGWIRGFPGAEKLATAAQQGFNDFQGRIEEFQGPPEVADAIAVQFKKSGAAFLCLSSYQLAGIVAFYTPELESRLWLPYLGRYRFPWINDRIWTGETALTAEWPHSGPDYSILFGTLTPPRALPVDGLRRPVFISLGKQYNPEQVRFKP